jgi:U3 small nucleolar RNA-associated protein 18
MPSVRDPQSTALAVRPDKRYDDDEEQGWEQEDARSSSDRNSKDETEIRLEKLLFGDDEGFRSALKSHTAPEGSRSFGSRRDRDGYGDNGEEEHGDEQANGDGEQDLEDVNDGDVCYVLFFSTFPFYSHRCLTICSYTPQLFFLDVGALGASPPIDSLSFTRNRHDRVRHHGLDQDREVGQNDEAERTPVWHDSDDDRLVVSLANHDRLRKLRRSEADDVVSGREYILRLRRQYLRLHPTPEWALPQKQKQKRRGHSDYSESESAGPDAADTDSDGDGADEPLSSQPLAKLLQNVGGDLVRREEGQMMQNGVKVRRLRQEVIGIQRLKDVGEKQPVSLLARKHASGDDSEA